MEEYAKEKPKIKCMLPQYFMASIGYQIKQHEGKIMAIAYHMI